MTLKERITEDMKSAMRSGEKERLATIRMALAAIKQREVDERVTLDDGQILGVLEKMIKQRREAITQFHSGGRADLVAKESAEITVLEAYLPAQMNPTEVDALITQAIAASGAGSIKDMGKVMAAIKSQAQGRADIGAVSALVRERLGRLQG
ncbi:MAG: GatB/YqeY domain-containing protein [Steroidobacteraceae bacterium]